MPFIKIKSVLPGIDLGAWQITEDELFFLERVKLYENEWKRLARIAHPVKRLEWLSSRLCMKELLHIADTVQVESLNLETGKPYLSNDSHHISYTHSSHYSAAIASETCEVGIDVEYLKRRRNPKTRFLWMNDAELQYFEEVQDFPFFLLAWSAKETVYKLFGSGVAFKHNIAINVKDLTIQDNGILDVSVNMGETRKKYSIAYAIHSDFLLTYTGDSLLKPISEHGH